eukprot:TRINITY_DN23990_c0_g1_i1.p1 TRINITY_DN23990_c0_g1~~TRINITY_DN23990_c0_g1_i1.p1  ORF type:complete len:411 (+),score=62.37 TRINITY_DN23990_c0_g1_i1:71-1303(+)
MATRRGGYSDGCKDDGTWELLAEEVGALAAAGLPMQLSPQWLNPLLRQPDPAAAIAAAQQPRSGVIVQLEVPTPLWSPAEGDVAGRRVAPGDDDSGVPTVACDTTFTLPPGYPLRAPVEQHGGDVSVQMTGHLTRQTQALLSRELHSLCSAMRERGAKAGRGAPQYVVECVDWLRSTELHAHAAALVPRRPRKARRRLWLRLHHIESQLKRAYAAKWAAELGVSGLLCAAQPALAVVEGEQGAVECWAERFTTVLHWGPTPCKQLLSTLGASGGSDLPLSGGLLEVGERYPECVATGGCYNGRDTVDYAQLEAALRQDGCLSAAADLCRLLPCMAHDGGRVEEAPDGSGWVGYSADLVLPAGAVPPPAGPAPSGEGPPAAAAVQPAAAAAGRAQAGGAARAKGKQKRRVQ